MYQPTFILVYSFSVGCKIKIKVVCILRHIFRTAIDSSKAAIYNIGSLFSVGIVATAAAVVRGACRVATDARWATVLVNDVLNAYNKINQNQKKQKRRKKKRFACQQMHVKTHIHTTTTTTKEEKEERRNELAR